MDDHSVEGIENEEDHLVESESDEQSDYAGEAADAIELVDSLIEEDPSWDESNLIDPEVSAEEVLGSIDEQLQAVDQAMPESEEEFSAEDCEGAWQADEFEAAENLAELESVSENLGLAPSSMMDDAEQDAASNEDSQLAIEQLAIEEGGEQLFDESIQSDAALASEYEVVSSEVDEFDSADGSLFDAAESDAAESDAAESDAAEFGDAKCCPVMMHSTKNTLMTQSPMTQSPMKRKKKFRRLSIWRP